MHLYFAEKAPVAHTSESPQLYSVNGQDVQLLGSRCQRLAKLNSTSNVIRLDEIRVAAEARELQPSEPRLVKPAGGSRRRRCGFRVMRGLHVPPSSIQSFYSASKSNKSLKLSSLFGNVFV